MTARLRTFHAGPRIAHRFSIANQETPHMHRCTCHQHEDDHDHDDSVGGELDDYVPLSTLDVIAAKLPPAQRERLVAQRQRGLAARERAERLRAQGHTVDDPLGQASPLDDEVADAMLSPSSTEVARAQRRAR